MLATAVDSKHLVGSFASQAFRRRGYSLPVTHPFFVEAPIPSSHLTPKCDTFSALACTRTSNGLLHPVAFKPEPYPTQTLPYSDLTLLRPHPTQNLPYSGEPSPPTYHYQPKPQPGELGVRCSVAPLS